MSEDNCHAGRDGDCIWVECPQLRDGEPVATGRHCPLDNGLYDAEDYLDAGWTWDRATKNWVKPA